MSTIRITTTDARGDPPAHHHCMLGGRLSTDRTLRAGAGATRSRSRGARGRVTLVDGRGGSLSPSSKNDNALLLAELLEMASMTRRPRCFVTATSGSTRHTPARRRAGGGLRTANAGDGGLRERDRRARPALRARPGPLPPARASRRGRLRRRLARARRAAASRGGAQAHPVRAPRGRARASREALAAARLVAPGDRRAVRGLRRGRRLLSDLRARATGETLARADRRATPSATRSSLEIGRRARRRARRTRTRAA